MPIERIPYSTAGAIFGGMTAEAINKILDGTALAARVIFAAEVAMEGDPVTKSANIEGSDFGVTPAGGQVPAGSQGKKFWDAMVRVKAHLNDPDFLNDVRSLDRGR